jgi:hypothetical protein
MKKIYSGHLAIRLENEIPKRLPGFRLFSKPLPRSPKPSNLSKGDVVFECRETDGLGLFLIFSKHPRQEEFNLDLAWTSAPEFPFALEIPSERIQPDGAEMRSDAGIVGFYELYPMVTGKSHLGWSVWKCSLDPLHPDFRRRFVEEDLQPVTDEQASERVSRAVNASIEDIQDVAIPYFARLRHVRATCPRLP